MISRGIPLIYTLHLGWFFMFVYTGNMIINWDAPSEEVLLPQSAKSETIESMSLVSYGLVPCRNIIGMFNERDWRK